MYLSIISQTPSCNNKHKPLSLNVINNDDPPSRNKKWNKDRLLLEAYKIHGDKYLYYLPEKITANSKLMITCKNCNTTWLPSLRNHIHNHSGCPICSHKHGFKPWSLERFLREGKEIHGQSYDYSLIKENDISNGNESRIMIICNLCGNKWECLIANHIFKKTGCPTCAGRAKYTLEIFIEKSREIYGDIFDYSLIMKDITIKVKFL